MTESNRIVLLDSLRGLAALVVVIHHAWVIFPQSVDQVYYFSPLLSQLWKTISDFNREAVLFFFILSGFSIALSSKRINWKENNGTNTYLYKRFKRILPLYWLALGFTLIAGIAGNYVSDPSFDLWNLIGNILLLQTSDSIRETWFVPFGKNGPLWSISYEMFYYILFVPIMLFQYRVLKNPLSHRLLFIGSLFLSLGAILIQKTVFLPWIYFINSFVIWYAGVYLYELYSKRTDDNWLFGTLLIALICVESIGLFRPDFRLNEFSSTLSALKNGFWIITIFYIGYLISKSSFSFSENKLFIAFNTIFKPIGDGSYTIYLIHYPAFLLIFSWGFDSWWIIIFSTVIISAFSVLAERKLITYPYNFFKVKYLP